MKQLLAIVLLFIFQTTYSMLDSNRFLEPKLTGLDFGSSPTRPYRISDLTEKLSPTTSRDQVSACQKETATMELTSSNLERWIEEDTTALLEESKPLPFPIIELDKSLWTLSNNIRALNKESHAVPAQNSNAKIILEKEILFLKTDQVIILNALAYLGKTKSIDLTKTYKKIAKEKKQKLKMKFLDIKILEYHAKLNLE